MSERETSHTTPTAALPLTPAMERFVLHWGEMGSRWGINRTIAQIHSLLYLAPRPLNAEEIAETLSVARSNVSTSLRELQNWGIVKLVHVLGDRRDHFESMTNVWEMFRVIVDQRKVREVDPTLSMLRDCVIGAREEGEAGALGAERMSAVLEFLETMTDAYEEMRTLPTELVLQMLQTVRTMREAGNA